MAKSGNQKGKLLYLAEIFHRETDEAHGLTLAELTERLAAYGVQAERKTLYADMEELRRCGLDIDSWKEGREYRYRLASREFELPELKLLVDAVQASRFITENKSRSLIKKLESLVSVHDARQLQRQVLIAGRVKTMNESIYYNIDKLHTAIGEGKQIRFQYFQWTVEKKEALRRDGGWYCVSPWHLRWDDENYYLIAYDAEADRVKHYRVDKMKRITLLEAPRLGQERMARFDPAVYTRRLFGMYGGQPVRVTLEGENEMVGVLIDRFGKEVPVLPVDGAHFQAFVDVAVSPQFLGWVAGLGGGLRIVSPEPVVQKMQALVQRLASSTVRRMGTRHLYDGFLTKISGNLLKSSSRCIEELLLCSIYRKKRRRANLIDGSDSEIHKIYYAKCTYSNIDNTLRTCYTQANGRKGPPAEGGQAS